jgi:hypothetical protein
MIQTRSLLAAGVAAAFATAAVCGPLPVTELNAQQAAQLSAYTQVPLSSANFSTSAMVDTQEQAKTQVSVQRASQNASAVYAAVSQFTMSPAPMPATSGPPPSSDVFDFKVVANSAQGWATTTASGMPFLFTQAFGESHAAGTASWRAQVTVTAASPNLYVQFRMPAAMVTGFTEMNGPSNWQSRLRAELQMNGHPVWSSEATRIVQIAGTPGDIGVNNCFNLGEKARYLSTFGKGLGFTSDANTDSTAKTVTLWLGTYPAGQTVEVDFVVRTDTQVFSPCCPKPVMDLPPPFCTRATAGVNWDAMPNPVRFWIGPNAP